MKDYYSRFISARAGAAKNQEDTTHEEVAKVAKPPRAEAERSFGGFATFQKGAHLDMNKSPGAEIDVVEKCFNGPCPAILEFKQGHAYCRRCGVYQTIVS